jgi:hypothetical protein
MPKRTQSDYVKMFQDSLNGFVQDLHPLGAMATGVITVVEMIDSEGKYFLHVIDDGKSPIWKLKGMLDAAHIQLDDKEFDEDED